MRAVSLIFIMAALWGVTGIIVGVGLSAYVGVNWLMECGSLNMAIGMILLQLVTRSETGRRIFYEGIHEEDELHLGIIFLWGLPVSMTLAGVLWWLIGQLFPMLS